MKMKRGETCRFGDNLEFERLIKILQNIINRPIHPLDIVGRIAVWFSSFVSQDL